MHRQCHLGRNISEGTCSAEWTIITTALRTGGVQRNVSLCRHEGVEGEPEGGLRQFTWMINELLVKERYGNRDGEWKGR